MYSDAISYASFLSDQMIQDAKFDAYIQECVLISEGGNTVENMQILTEAFGDKIKIALAKVVEIFTRLCGKFMETINNIFSSNKGYLEKYKDIILKNKPTDTKWSLYNWAEGMKVCLSTPIPEFNYDALVKDESFKSKDTFIDKHFANLMKDQKAGAKLEEVAKFRFRGDLSEEQEKDEASLNITDMYNFCIRYDTMKSYLQKDIKSITDAAKSVQDQIAKMARETGSTPTPTTTPKPEVKTATNDAVDYYLNDNRKYYSFVYEGYVVEGKKVEDNTKSADNKPDNSQPASNQSSGSNYETDPSKAMSRTDATKVSKETNVNVTDTKEAETLIDNIKTVYIDSCMAVDAAKMQCIEEAYKDYMMIIKNKVQFYVGTKDKDNKQQADAATNQKPTEPGEKPEDPKEVEKHDGIITQGLKKLGVLK